MGTEPRFQRSKKNKSSTSAGSGEAKTLEELSAKIAEQEETIGNLVQSLLKFEEQINDEDHDEEFVVLQPGEYLGEEIG